MAKQVDLKMLGRRNSHQFEVINQLTSSTTAGNTPEICTLAHEGAVTAIDHEKIAPNIVEDTSETDEPSL